MHWNKLTFEFSPLSSARSFFHHTPNVITQNPIIVENPFHVDVVIFWSIFAVWFRRCGRCHSKNTQDTKNDTHGSVDETGRCCRLPGLISTARAVNHYASKGSVLRLRNHPVRSPISVCLHFDLEEHRIVSWQGSLQTYSAHFQTSLLFYLINKGLKIRYLKMQKPSEWGFFIFMKFKLFSWPKGCVERKTRSLQSLANWVSKLSSFGKFQRKQITAFHRNFVMIWVDTPRATKTKYITRNLHDNIIGK